MGGSSCKPDDLKGNRPKKRKDLLKKHEQLILNIETHLWQLGLCFENLPNRHYREWAIDWLKLIQKELSGLEELENKLKTKESWLIPINLTRRVRGLLEDKSYYEAEKHFEMLKLVTNGTIKRCSQQTD